MDYNISEILGDIKGTLLKGAAVMLITGIITHIIMPKPTTIHVEEGVPAELYTLGKKGNPKMVYVSTKKHDINLAPAALMLIAGLFAGFLKKSYDENNAVVK